MREIKFRGKRIDNGEWVYGYFAMLPQPSTAFLFIKPYIILSYYDYEDECGFKIPYLVDENTVGQFTGLYDKNGKEIYEGDVVIVRKISIDDKLYEAKVLFQQIGRSGFAYSIDYKDDNGTLFYGLQEQKYIEVIGNIHEEKVPVNE